MPHLRHVNLPTRQQALASRQVHIEKVARFFGLPSYNGGDSLDNIARFVPEAFGTLANFVRFFASLRLCVESSSAFLGELGALAVQFLNSGAKKRAPAWTPAHVFLPHGDDIARLRVL